MNIKLLMKRHNRKIEKEYDADKIVIEYETISIESIKYPGIMETKHTGNIIIKLNNVRTNAGYLKDIPFGCLESSW